MNTRKEIFWGLIWGIAAVALVLFLMTVNAWSMDGGIDDGIIEVTITADSVAIQIDKDGRMKTITMGRDEFEKTVSGISVRDEIIIENGRIIIDGLQLTEEEIDRLAIDSEQEDSAAGIGFGHHDKRVIRRKRLATVYTETEGDIVKFGDVIVGKNERVDGDVVCIGGDARIDGEVEGDVVAVFGDIILTEYSHVSGDAVAPLGRVHRDDGAVIEGDAVSKMKIESKKNTASFGMGGRFNRVEGLTIVPSMTYESKDGEYPTLKLEAAYAFTLKRWEYDIRVSHEFGRFWGPKINGSIYRIVQSPDHWLIPWQEENSLAALLFKEDFLDYYWMRGFTGGTGLWYGEYFDFGISYTAAKMSTLKRTADKALFGGKKKFRENWSTVLPDSAAILGMEGDLRELGIGITYDSRDDKYDATNGLLANLHMSRTVDSDSSDFDYRALDAEVKWYQPLTHDQILFVRFRGGFSDDDLPLFRRYFIGGLGSLRGYDYKEFEGNRYILFNADYIWRFFDSDFGAGLFFDSGKAAFGESRFESSDLKSSVGVSFIVSDVLRLNLAQRLDDIDKSPVFSARAKILF